MSTATILSSPGPHEVEHQGFIVGQPASNDMFARRDWLVGLHRQHKDRVTEVTQVVNGEWYNVWPDLTRVPEAPTVANIVEIGINHWSSIFGAMLPSLRVPVPVTADRAQGKRGARKRERRVRELWEKGNISELSALWGGDYAGGGSAFMAAWVNFEEPDPAKRDPHPMRFDPRHAYPLKDSNGNVTELLVARLLTRDDFEAQYPVWTDRIPKKKGETLEEWFWFSNDRIRYIIADVSKEGRKEGRSITLVDEENTLGFLPVWEVVRPTFDGQRRGVFDQTLHILRTIHRLMTLTIYATEEDVYPPMLEYNVINPEDVGPGAVLHARSQDAKMDRIVSPSRFDVKNLIATLTAESRVQSAWPQQLSGDPGASIVSARGINASMGQIDARLSMAHKQFEVGFSKMSSFLLALDEAYCDGDKTVRGAMRESKEAESYRPSRDVAGNYAVVCTYGIGAGSDPASKEMRLAMHLANEALSIETYREELDFLDDPDTEELRRTRQDVRKAIVVGLLQQATQGQIEGAAKMMDLLRKEDVSIDEVMAELVEFIQAPTAPGGPGGDPAAAALGQAESLMKGGIPGNAAQGPASPALPPLGDLMGPGAGSRMVGGV